MSVTDIRADNALRALVESIIPCSSGKDGSALYIRLDLRVAHYGFAKWEGEILERTSAQSRAMRACEKLPEDTPEEDYPCPENVEGSSDIHFLVFRPTNYTQVYALANKSWDIPTAKDEWLLYSDHDSCWKTDGFRIIDAEVDRLQQELLPVKVTIDQHLAWSVDCTIANVKRMTVVTERVCQPPDPKHRRKIVSLKKKKEIP